MTRKMTRGLKTMKPLRKVKDRVALYVDPFLKRSCEVASHLKCLFLAAFAHVNQRNDLFKQQIRLPKDKIQLNLS